MRKPINLLTNSMNYFGREAWDWVKHLIVSTKPNVSERTQRNNVEEKIFLLNFTKSKYESDYFPLECLALWNIRWISGQLRETQLLLLFCCCCCRSTVQQNSLFLKNSLLILCKTEKVAFLTPEQWKCTPAVTYNLATSPNWNQWSNSLEAG
jgi:hypothetical protein